MLRSGSCLLLICAVCSVAADNVGGRWSGKLKLSSGNEAAPEVAMILVLQQDGSTLSGTICAVGKAPAPIQSGSIKGARVTFDVPGQNPSLKFAGTLIERRLKLDVEGSLRVGEEERQLKGSMDMTREKRVEFDRTFHRGSGRKTRKPEAI